MTKEKIKSAIESILFVWGDPLEAKVVADLFDIPTSEALQYFRELQEDYEEKGSGLCLREIDKSFQLCTNPENDDYIQRLCTPVRTRKLSQSSLEVLAIIAYKQPVTKAQIESIRGIRSDRVLEGLMLKGLVEELGRSNAIGRPYLYGTTKEFLRLFGFESLKELPEIEEIDELITEEDPELDTPLADQIAMDVNGEQTEI
ncbi:MAG: SMC-Scp complex subunit ScpB [Clostridia bacterium]|nr:SMC-Scp complex subunit ScpB [Clostridia bacterium]